LLFSKKDGSVNIQTLLLNIFAEQKEGKETSMKSYSLELRRFKIRDVQFGNATAYANGV